MMLVGHGFQKSPCAEILPHYDSSHLSIVINVIFVFVLGGEDRENGLFCSIQFKKYR